MRYIKSKSQIYFSIIFLLLICIGIGYAILTTNLTMSGNIIVSKNIIEVASKLKKDLPSSNLDASDSSQTFIVGTDPNNYVWYSGKLWRIVSINPIDNTVKMITADSISLMGSYNINQKGVYTDSFIREWLNNTATDGFYGSLFNSSSFLKTDTSWNATLTSSFGVKPANTTMITNSVGLLNSYELNKTNKWANNNQYFFTMTPSSSTSIWVNGNVNSFAVFGGVQTGLEAQNGCMIRPVVNLLNTVKIYKGKGTKTEPYLLSGDTGSYSGYTGQLVNRYSGEYVTFSGKTWRIVSTDKATSTIKLVMASSSTNRSFSTANSNVFSPAISTNVGYYLNTTFYNSLTSNSQTKIVTGSWYQGAYIPGSSWKLEKCATVACSSFVTTISAKVGLLRNAELMSGQVGDAVQTLWTLTPYSNMVLTSGTHGSNYPIVANSTTLSQDNTTMYVRPALNISDVAVKSGNGTKQSPWNIGY